MTTATPAKKATRTASATPPAFDFGKVTPKETAAKPKTTGGRERVQNPVIPWVKASWDARTRVGSTSGRVSELGKGATVTVPTANVTQLRNLLNYAARDLGVGVAIETKDVAGGKTEVTYWAKTRKEKKATKENGNTES